MIGPTEKSCNQAASWASILERSKERDLEVVGGRLTLVSVIHLSFIGERGMKWRIFALILCLCGSGTSKAQEQPTLLPDAPKPQPGIIVGTVTDLNDDSVPSATVVLEGPALKNPRTVVSNDNGFFEFKDVEPATYQVTVSAQGFANWTSPAVIVKPSQYEILTRSE